MMQRASHLVMSGAMPIVTRFVAGLCRLVTNRSGAAAIEFALLAPIFVVLYIGAVEFSDAFTAKRKVTTATSTLGDLITRSKEISNADMTDILESAPRAVLRPYRVTNNNLAIKVTCAAIDQDKVATAMWSEARNSKTDTAGSTIVVPTGVALPNSKVVFVDVTYKYEPRIGRFIQGDTVDLNSNFYFKPREANTVCYNGTCC